MASGIWLLMITLALAGNTHAAPMVIDGDLSEWEHVKPLALDGPDTVPVDLRSISICHDPVSIFFRLELATRVNLQVLPEGTLSLLLNADLDENTGATVLGMRGIDATIEFSPARNLGPKPPRYGVLIRTFDARGESQTHTAYGTRLLVSPTYSASSFELHLPRNDQLISLSKTGFDVTVVTTGADGLVVDELPRVNYRYADHGVVLSRSSPSPETSIPRPPGNPLRVLTWNIADSSFRRNHQRFGSILGALRPDVLMLDEAPGDINLDEIHRLLADMEPDTPKEAWHVVLGRGGGRQRGVIIARQAISELAQFSMVHYPPAVVSYIREHGTRTMQKDLKHVAQEAMPVAGVSLDWSGKRLYLVVLDMQCCGRDGSPEDQFRSMQADTLRAALAAAMDEHRPDGLIIGGDVNLVGSRTPLERLFAGADLDGSDLAPVRAMQLDGLSNATYGFSGSFPPGQLDWVLYSDSVLKPINAFVFDTRDLNPEWLSRYDLEIDDSRRSSDHRPVVVDFVLR